MKSSRTARSVLGRLSADPEVNCAPVVLNIAVVPVVMTTDVINGLLNSTPTKHGCPGAVETGALNLPKLAVPLKNSMNDVFAVFTSRNTAPNPRTPFAVAVGVVAGLLGVTKFKVY